MKRQVNEAVRRVADALETWDGIDTITLMEGEEDVYDPYFFLSVDAYYRGPLLDADRRRELFPFAGAFESSLANRKDRFLMGDLPVRVEYKDIARFEDIIRGDSVTNGAFRDSGTYMFFRLQHCSVIRSRSDWIEQIRNDITQLRDEFWDGLRASVQSRMEHFVSDLGAAVIQNDDLFYLVSAAGFIRSLTSLLFAINRRFEPSARLLAEQTLKLPVLPESFRGRFDSFLRRDSEITREKKFEIAELLARSVLNL
ncbi:hypothetical protein [Salinispira pacifica]